MSSRLVVPVALDPSCMGYRSTGEVLFSDDFERADGALGAPWVQIVSTWNISSGLAQYVSGGVGSRPMAVVPVGAADVAITATATIVSGAVAGWGLALAVQDTTNLYFVFSDPVNARWTLRRSLTGDTAHDLAFGGSAPANGDVVTFARSGDALTVVVNSVQIIATTDSSPALAGEGQGHGLINTARNTSARTDNVIIRRA
jgi:hypothetical protein